MSQEQIFQPMLALMVLTAIVWFVLYAKRIPAMRRIGKPAQTYTSPGSVVDLLPEEISYPANNFKNLFELPVLFYGLCLYLYVTGTVTSVDVLAAWVFVLLRVVHSAIHCTVNIVMARFIAYALGALVLWFMLGRAVWSVAGAAAG